MKNITQLNNWTRGITDPQTKKELKQLIRNDLSKGGKNKSRLQTLFNTGKYQSLANNVNAMQPERYSGEDRICDLCGTHHQRGFLCRWPGEKGAQMELQVGGVCESYLKALPGVRDKFASAINAAKKTHQDVLAKHLEDLLASEHQTSALLLETTPKAKLAQGTYLLDWLQGVSSESLKDELQRAKTEDARVDQGMLAQLVGLVVTQRKLKASAYQNVIKDVKLMEKEGLAPQGLHDEFKGRLTTQEANEILSRTSERYQQFRARKNKEAMHYGSIDTMLGLLQPVILDSKEKVREDFMRGYVLSDKVFTPRDTQFLLGLVKEWKNEKGAVNETAVVDFGKKYDRLALLNAKLTYAMEAVKAVEHEQQPYGMRQRIAMRDVTEARLNAISGTLQSLCHFVDNSYANKIEFLQRCYSKDEKITRVQPKLAELARMAAQGFLPEVERKQVDTAFNRADRYCRPVHACGHEVYRAQAAVREGTITHIDFLDIEKFKDDRTMMDWRVVNKWDKNKLANALYKRGEQVRQGQTGMQTHLGVTYTLPAAKIKDLG